MKRIALLMICIVFSTSMISCKQKEESNVPTDNVPTEFPKWIQFYSYEGLEEYVSSVEPNTKTYMYDSARSTYNIYGAISYKEAKKSVSDMTGTVIPRPKDGVQVETFEASYYVGYRDAFEIKYRINGILYVFTYSYNGKNPVGKEKKPGWTKHMPFNNTMALNNYGCYGETTKGKTAIRIWVYTHDYHSIHLEQFGLEKLSK